MASVTITVPNSDWLTLGGQALWLPLTSAGYISLGNTLSVGGATELFFGYLTLGVFGGGSSVSIRLSDGTSDPSDAGPDFSELMENEGSITFTASDSSSVTVFMAGSDSADPYNFSPSNSADVQVFADNLIGLTDRSLTVTFDDSPIAAPLFSEDTGDAQNWIQNTTTVDFIIPDADGNPAPTYAVEGSLPAGIAFDTIMRVLSGTPTAVGSGTITIRATNSEGTDDWTVVYLTSAQGTDPDSVIANLEGYFLLTSIGIQWLVDVSLGSVFSDDGIEQILNSATLYFDDRVSLSIVGSNRRFTPDFEATGRIIFEASDGEMLEVMIADADMSEPYLWEPINGDEVAAFIGHVQGLSDQRGLLTLTTRAAVDIAPSFADDTGDAQSWTQNQAITALTVPAADGTPTPTYAEVGVLPAGISFNITTRVLSGTPTATGSGTITIRATNSEGDADWTVDYTTAAALAAPVFADDTGDAQTWIENDAITPLTVPAATGNPTPTYAAVGTLPAGITFNTTTRVLSGTPTATGSGTITIRATNSAGTADWTVDYATAAALAAPSFSDDTGDAQAWTQNQPIASITVPAANGNPTPTYVAVGTLPAGISFNTTTRVISGRPTALGSGTITIRASNSEGDADWTVAYTTAAAATAPARPDAPDVTVLGGIA